MLTIANLLLAATAAPQAPVYSDLSQVLFSGTPQQVAGFGLAVARFGGMLCASEPGAWDPATNRRGRVWVFDRNSVGEFSAAHLLLPPTPNSAAGRFGYDLDCGDDLVAVADTVQNGATGNGHGVVHLYERTQGQWSFATTLAPPNYNNGEVFGGSVHINGDHIFVGSVSARVAGVDSGIVRRFSRATDGTWFHSQRITPPSSALQENMGFGSEIAATDGALTISAPFNDVGSIVNAGSVITYRSDATSGAFTFSEEVVSLAPQIEGRFGASLDFHRNTSRVAIGASGEGSTGAVYLAHADLAGMLVGMRELKPSVGLPGIGDFGKSLSFTDSGALLVGAPTYVCDDGCPGVGAVMRFCGPLDDLRLVEVVTNPAVLLGGTLGANVVGDDDWFASGVSAAVGGGQIAAGAVGVYDSTPVPTCSRSFIGELYCEGATLDCPLGPGQAGVGCPNSAGEGAALRVRGLPRLNVDDTDGFASGLPGGALCLLAIGELVLTPTLPAAMPMADGFLCIGPVHSQLRPRFADPNGSLQFESLLNDGSSTWPLGQRFAIQCWFRDSGGTSPSANSTNAVVLRLTE